MRVRGRVLLGEVSLDAPAGAVTGLLGPNGSGKSTLLRVLAGLRRPDAGTVLLDGVDRATLPRRALARRIAIVTQHVPSDVDMSVLDVLLLARIPHRPALAPATVDDERRAEDALAAAGLPGIGHRRWSRLSGGERQRADLARALLQDPDVLLLDEPTNHLDIRHRLALFHRLRGSGRTVVAALHDLDLAAAFCDRIALLHDGRLVSAGTPAEVLTPARIRDVYGVEAEVSAGDDGRPRIRITP
ncbi:ABC transporter ATP-binding protein [Catenuloplanes atrovinosus]|uniref:Iron complex transport system ATP-binding protein n=1 Tax=Catenuloplanes atrovinosus TaxID=137266 RepID=A0AAE3YT73_9ACTN|nr:ABC transporter ATP-binding protein [Catenuloplanes atrovinosus]MDR7277431.1 iron complex transport system ATP-binding protein [Catenuloplanes atrovinosus]